MHVDRRRHCPRVAPPQRSWRVGSGVIRSDAVHLSTLVDMVESGLGDRTLVGPITSGLTGEQLAALVRRAGTTLRGTCASLVYAGENHPLLPVATLGAACA